jgi:hypothetical protein
MITEEQDKILRNFDAASNAIRKATGGKAAEGIEKKYGQAYQDCVKAGLKPQLRKKYR